MAVHQIHTESQQFKTCSPTLPRRTVNNPIHRIIDTRRATFRTSNLSNDLYAALDHREWTLREPTDIENDTELFGLCIYFSDKLMHLYSFDTYVVMCKNRDRLGVTSRSIVECVNR